MTIINRQLRVALEPFIGLPHTPWNFDASNGATIFTDVNGTTPVSANNQLVGNWRGAVTVATPSATNAPVYRTDLYDWPVIRFDGQGFGNEQHLEMAIPTGAISNNNFSWYGVVKIVGHNLAQGIFMLSEDDYPGFQTDKGMFVGSDEVVGSIKTTRGPVPPNNSTFIKSDQNWLGEFSFVRIPSSRGFRRFDHRWGSPNL